VQLVVGAGASVLADSDGTTYDANGGQVTGGGTGAHGLQNTSAWIHFLGADGVAEVTIQRGTSESEWTVKVYPEGGATGGNATTAPSGSGALGDLISGLALLPDGTHTARIGIQGGDRFGWYIVAGTKLMSYHPAPTAPHVRFRWTDDFTSELPTFNYDRSGPNNGTSFEAVERYV